MMRQITHGAPWDQDGVDMRGRKVNEKPMRPTSLADELEAQQRRDGFINLARDEDQPNFAERRMAQEAAEQLITAIADDPRLSAGQELPLSTLHDETSLEFLGGKPGLAPEVRQKLAENIYDYMDSLTAEDHKRLRKEARAMERQAGAQQAVLDDLWNRFRSTAPELAELDQRDIEDAAKRAAQDLGATGGGLNLDDPEDRQLLVDLTITELRERAEKSLRPAPRQINGTLIVNDGDTPGDGLGDAILEWQRKCGLF